MTAWQTIINSDFWVGLHKSKFFNSNQVKSNHMFLKKIQVKSNQVKTSLKFPKSSQVKSLDFEKKVKSSQVKSESVNKRSSQVKSSCDAKITFKSDQIIVSHSKQTILYHQVRQAFSQEFQVQIKIKSRGLHPIFKSNQVKSEIWSSNQIKSIWFDLTWF